MQSNNFVSPQTGRKDQKMSKNQWAPLMVPRSPRKTVRCEQCKESFVANENLRLTNGLCDNCRPYATVGCPVCEITWGVYLTESGEIPSDYKSECRKCGNTNCDYFDAVTGQPWPVGGMSEIVNQINNILVATYNGEVA